MASLQEIEAEDVKRSSSCPDETHETPGEPADALLEPVASAVAEPVASAVADTFVASEFTLQALD